MKTLIYRDREFRYFHALDFLSWNEQARINVLLALGMFIGEDGSIFIRHRNRNKRSFYLQRFVYLSKAISSLDRIIGNYIMGDDDGHSELSIFSNLNNIIDGVTIARNKLNGPETIRIGSVNLEETIVMLRNCRLQLKDNVRKQLGMLTSDLDSLGRVNPCAKLAIASSLKSRVERRRLQMETSIGLARERRHALRMENIFEEKNLLLAKALLESLLRDPERGGEDKRRRIGQIRYHLQSIWLLPYREEAEKLKELLPK